MSRSPAGLAVAALTLTLATTAPAAAWMHDLNANRVDDRIERVHALGRAAAFENDDPSGRLRFGVSGEDELVYDVYVVYDRVPTAVDAAAVAASGVPWVRPYLYFPAARTRADFAQVQLLAALPGVRRIEVVPAYYPDNHVTSRTLRARHSRGYVKAQNDDLFPSAHRELGFDGAGMVIAIFDTGVNDEADLANPGYPGHESLKGKFVGGGEFFYGNPALNTPNDQVFNPQDHGALASQYHGTHVAGTAMGSGGPGGTFAGIAPAARLVDCKVLSDAGATVGGVSDALEYCLANRTRLWPGLAGADTAYRGVDVVNMSLGGIENSDGTDLDAVAVNIAVRRGLTVVAASGNLGTQNWIASPASADSAITVGATTHSKTLKRTDDAVTSFSQEGPRANDGDADKLDEMKPNLVAPGFGIVSADGDPTTDGRFYKSISGTSMASPAVAGAVALLLQAKPDLTPLQVRAILQNTAEHFIPSQKGTRPNNPFGVDPNYNPGCGWGQVDLYAALKEVLNSTGGVQVTQMKKPVSRVADGAIDLGWIAQREYPFLGYEVHRAPDAGGTPGAFARINPVLVPPAAGADPILQNDDNRTSYAYADTDPALQLGETYWYRVAWVDLGGAVHPEPALSTVFGESPRVATAHYVIVHDSPDGDLNVRVGTSSLYTTMSPEFVTFGPGEAAQDSFQVSPIDFFYFPPGHIRHFWSIGFTTDDGIAGLLPPSPAHPWFLDVREGGFIDQSGRVESFSMFVHDAPGSAGGTTYVTDSPTPQPTVETAAVTLWIPEDRPVSALVARFEATAEGDGVRLALVLSEAVGEAVVRVWRGPTAEWASAAPLAPAQPLAGTVFEFLDREAAPGVRHHYWTVLETAAGRTIVSGPVAVTALDAIRRTRLAAPAPNPARGARALDYAIGADLAGGGPVEVRLGVYDLRGRRVAELDRGARGPGQYRIEWAGTDDRGARLAPGVYLVRLTAGEHEYRERLVIAP